MGQIVSLSRCLFLLCIIQFIVSSCHSGTKSIDQEVKEILVTAPGKREMILLTDRPANLETPLKYFKLDYTPNDVFFVRWHNPVLPKAVDEDTFRLRVKGWVNKELSLSLQDLKTKFPKDSIVALAVCAGNARSFCDPRVPGGQWKNGAMGNALWTGVKLKDVLNMAGVKSGAYEVSFNGLDRPAINAVPDFEKALKIDHAIDDEVMIAYEMNGEALPLLNGYPLKLVVPGWYATYWVGMLHEITIHPDTFKGFWMKKAYLIPKGVKDANEKPDSLSKDMEPVNKLDIRSIFVSPEPNSILKIGVPAEIEGLAFDSGDEITRVEISKNDGKTWELTKLDPSLGKYAWRRWRYAYTPTSLGTYSLKVRATNSKGDTQPEHHWNRSGYMRNEIEELRVTSNE
ncbi:MAG: molybdopterin-dependent oxidoreductase [Saprospiraceae bacterium]